MSFDLDPRLSKGSALLVDLELCQARLQLDGRFPWIVLVPRRVGLRELEDLSPSDLSTLTREVVITGKAVRAAGLATGRAVEKLNVGVLGNIVSQLHVHVVGRHVGDAAWPGPVWGAGQAAPYDQAMLQQTAAAAHAALRPGEGFALA